MFSQQQLFNSVNKFLPSSSQQKFINHFQSISTPAKSIPKPETLTHSNHRMRDTFVSKIQGYKSDNSIIDSIVDEPISGSPLRFTKAQKKFDIVEKPMLLNLNSNIKQRIKRVNEFFEYNTLLQNKQSKSTIFNLEGYVSMVSAMPLLEKRKRSESKSRSKSQSIDEPHQKLSQSKYIKSTPPQYPFSNPSVEANNSKEASPRISSPTRQLHFSPENTERNRPKWSKIDLLLMEIMRQKKRKGFVEDYDKAIKMKLIELLDYILQDELEYYGLNLTDKMKKVLKNLQNFKGKTVDGQSKVNMLRIFFEEFRNLKREQEEEEMIQKQRSQVEGSKKGPKSKHSDKSQRLQKNKNLVASNKKLINNSRKESETFSVGGRPSNNKVMKGPQTLQKQDHWIGSL